MGKKKKKLVKSRQASAIGLAFPCSILQFFLLLQNLKAEPRCPPPTCSLFFVDTPKTSSYVFIKKTTTNPWQHILNDQVFTKSTTTNFTVKKRIKRETKQKMNGVIYYLLTSFTARRKKNQGHEVHQNKTLSRLTTTDWPYQFVWPLRQCTA